MFLCAFFVRLGHLICDAALSTTMLDYPKWKATDEPPPTPTLSVRSVLHIARATVSRRWKSSRPNRLRSWDCSQKTFTRAN